MNSFAQRTVSVPIDDAFIPSLGCGINLEPAQSEFSQDPGKQAHTQLILHLTFYAAAAIFVTKALTGLSLDLATVVSTGTTYAALGLAHWTLRTGHQLWAARLLVYSMLLLLSSELYQTGGLRSGATAFFTPLLLFAGTTLGRQGLLLCSCLTFGLCTLLATLAQLGLLPALPPLPDSVAWLEMFIALGISVVILRNVLLDLHGAQARVVEAEQQQREAQLRYFKAQKLEPMARLATGVAHDFNNLLGVIANVTASLRIETPKHAGIQELLDDLDSVTARAGMMTGQLLTFNRPRATKIEVIDFEEFLRSLMPLLGRLLGDEIEVRCAGSTDSLALEADRGQLEQVMLNLVVNARDAMPRGGLLTIRIGCVDDERVSVSVEDTGVGIADEIQDKIFSAFFTTKEAGNGLGLATVMDIVKSMHGTVQVKSSPNQGSCFTISLPATREKASEGPRSLSRVRLQSRSARILLAEDHELMRRATQRMLEQAGYSVTSVVNGQDALVLLQGGAPFDVLLTDVSMPVLSGFELAEKLSRQGQGLPTVFISGAGPHLSHCLDTLTFKTRYLAKPFAQQDLIDAIEECLAKVADKALQN